MNFVRAVNLEHPLGKGRQPKEGSAASRDLTNAALGVFELLDSKRVTARDLAHLPDFGNKDTVARLSNIGMFLNKPGA